MSKKRKKWELDRRTFLKCSMGGAATLMGLPLLEAMMSSVARAATAGYVDANYVAFFKPLGIMREKFLPSQYQKAGVIGQPLIYTGTQWAIDNFSTQPLLPHKDVINMFGGAGFAVRGFDHAEESVRFLTCLSPLSGVQNYNDVRLDPGSIPTQGKSVDQYIADLMFQADNPLKPAIHSLQVCSDKRGTSALENQMSYVNATTPKQHTADLTKIFDSIFFGFNPGATTNAITERDLRKRNVLDDIWNSGTKSLINSLGKSDRLTVEQYLASIEAVKKKIDDFAASNGPVANACQIPTRPTNVSISNGVIASVDLKKHFEIMTDLIVLALQCNRTKVATYMMSAAGGSGRDWTFLIPEIPDGLDKAGISSWLRLTDFHLISHFTQHPTLGKDAGLWANAMIDRFYVERFAYFISRLKATNLIDRTFAVFGAGFGNPEHHSSRGIPLVTAGRGAGAKTNMLKVFRGYEYYDSGGGLYASMARFHVETMNAFGVSSVNINNFGLRKDESLSNPDRTHSFGIFA